MDGIKFPITGGEGVYRVDLGVSLVAATTPIYWSSLYIDVMGAAWTKLDVRSYINW